MSRFLPKLLFARVITDISGISVAFLFETLIDSHLMEHLDD